MSSAPGASIRRGTDRPRLVLLGMLGMRGEFSRAALAALLKHGARVEALIVPRRVPGEEARRALPPRRSLLGPEDAVALAR